MADDLGKTALHWAASVNNVEAVQILLYQMANKDAQNNRVSYIEHRLYCFNRKFTFRIEYLKFVVCHVY